MSKINEMEQEDLQKLRQSFSSAMTIAYRLFGRYAFRRQYAKNNTRYPINKALFEAWAVNLGKLTEDQLDSIVASKDEMIDAFIDLMNTDKEFEVAISQGTGSIKRVQLRFSRIHTLIREKLTCR